MAKAAPWAAFYLESCRPWSRFGTIIPRIWVFSEGYITSLSGFPSSTVGPPERGIAQMPCRCRFELVYKHLLLLQRLYTALLAGPFFFTPHLTVPSRWGYIWVPSRVQVAEGPDKAAIDSLPTVCGRTLAEDVLSKCSLHFFLQKSRPSDL